jgi:molybdenum cofactor cytidylyltransferase
VKFGETPLGEAVGAVLAHSVRLADRILKKGHVLGAADVAALATAGHATVIAARLEAGDVGENVAADQVAQTLGGANVTVGRAFTGRANLYAERAGLCVVDRAGVDRFNRVDETITLATLMPDSLVTAKEMVATVKIIPFAVARMAVEACSRAAGAAGALVSVVPFRPHRVALLQTRLPGMKESILDKTVETTRLRLEALGSTLLGEHRTGHREAELAPAITQALAGGAELVLIAGASAIVDRRDVIPAAIVACGGAIEHFGMPVDPGNLMLMARVGAVPVLGLPVCARSPRVNGFDWVLRRVPAGLPVDAAALSRMGVGGLLTEIPERPLPRAQATADAPAAPHRPRIAALVLAAGRSQRMGTMNKLLIVIDGAPMVRHVVAAAQAAKLAPIIVVTGHERERIEAALAGLALRFVHNPAYADGLSTSLQAGLAALPDESDGVLVGLGDMPRIGAGDIERLVAAFNPVEGRGIIVPTWRGKRGNPVLWAKRYFPEMCTVAGDVGARHLIGAYPEAVVEVEMASDAVLTDIDTPQALARLAAVAKVEV